METRNFPALEYLKSKGLNSNLRGCLRRKNRQLKLNKTNKD